MEKIKLFVNKKVSTVSQFELGEQDKAEGICNTTYSLSIADVLDSYMQRYKILAKVPYDYINYLISRIEDVVNCGYPCDDIKLRDEWVTWPDVIRIGVMEDDTYFINITDVTRCHSDVSYSCNIKLNDNEIRQFIDELKHHLEGIGKLIDEDEKKGEN